MVLENLEMGGWSAFTEEKKVITEDFVSLLSPSTDIFTFSDLSFNFLFDLEIWKEEGLAGLEGNGGALLNENIHLKITLDLVRGRFALYNKSSLVQSISWYQRVLLWIPSDTSFKSAPPNPYFLQNLMEGYP